MAKKNDLQHFMRFSLLAVFAIAVLAVLGLASLVMSGPGSISFPTANLAGQAVTELQAYHIGEFTRDGFTHDIKINVAELTLNIMSRDGDTEQAGLQESGDGLVGVWASGREAVPISVSDGTLTFHFHDGSERVQLRTVHQR